MTIFIFIFIAQRLNAIKREQSTGIWSFPVYAMNIW